MRGQRFGTHFDKEIEEMYNSGMTAKAISVVLGVSRTPILNVLDRLAVPRQPKHQCSLEDLAGQRFGRLVAIRFHGYKWECGRATWLCACDCGNETIVAAMSLKKGVSESCGCLHSELLSERSITHGRSKDAIYRIWAGIKQRCCNPSTLQYHDYGGRGISMCEEWRSDFVAFVWHVGERPSPLHTIERINCNGNYEPGNVCWLLRADQNSNKRNTHAITVDDLTLTLAQWSRRSGVSCAAIYTRVRYGWTWEEAVSTPKIIRVAKKPSTWNPSPERRAWNNMISRCHNPNNRSYASYGARGIKVCREWRESKESFLEYIGPRPSAQYSLDRYPNQNGDYEPGNVRWATKIEQMNNTRKNKCIRIFGQTKTLSEWCREFGIKPSTAQGRRRRGWNWEKAITTPLK